MKKITLLLICAVYSLVTFAQISTDDIIFAGDKKEQLKIVYINKDVSTHFITMEGIQYVDISVEDIVGDIPTENTLRVKPVKENANGVITIVTERFLVQYMLVYTDDYTKAYTRFNIPYEDLRSYLNPETTLTKSEMYDYAYKMFVSDKSYYDISTTKNRMRITLNNIYTIDHYFFIDLSLINKTNIIYDIDQIRFKIEDKKQTKATNFQSVEIFPLMELSKDKIFNKNYRNIFVFEKFTFPDEKVFSIEISEKQISGRTINMQIDYSDVLNADCFNVN
ncbi:conjugative transposon protein TraN [Bacteroidia bacterium]|nr:conjugative transposon protein TraN [Bacteroidia bacterium]GHT61551.1 conjugative transposon protein TraN [Bacteroidia bacterium]